MSILWLESFDLAKPYEDSGSSADPGMADLATKGWVVNQPNEHAIEYVTTGGRTGQGCFFQASNTIIVYSPSLSRQVTPAQEHVTFCMGFALNIQSTGFFSDICWIGSDEIQTQHVKLGIGPGGQLHVYAGPGLPLVGSSSVLMKPNNWNYIELMATLSSSSGLVTVNVNDAQVIYLPNINTKNGGTKTTFDSIGWTVDKGTQYVIDDHYLTNGAGTANTGALGDMNIDVIRPNGNGDLSELTNDNGTNVDNYTYVDSQWTQTTTFVWSASPDAEDTYQMDDLPDPTGTVIAVQTVILAQKNNTGDRQIIPIIRESGTDYEGTPVHLGTSLAYYEQVFEQDPASSGQWSVAAVNAAQMGVRVE